MMAMAQRQEEHPYYSQDGSSSWSSAPTLNRFALERNSPVNSSLSHHYDFVLKTPPSSISPRRQQRQQQQQQEEEDHFHGLSGPEDTLLLTRMDEDGPDFRYMQNLLFMLLLSTILAMFSAWDAKNQCRSWEGYGVHDEFLDDDEIQQQGNNKNNNNNNNAMANENLQQERYECLVMFRVVIIPVSVTVMLCGTISLFLLQQHQKWITLSTNNNNNNNPSSSAVCTSATTLDLHRWHYTTCQRLVVLLTLIMLAWVFGTVAIMMRPRVDDDNNPYESLAAVDRMGHVGDNANLYYLCWISVGLGTALFYQICVDTVRQYRRYQREKQQHKPSFSTNNNSKTSSSSTSSSTTSSNGPAAVPTVSNGNYSIHNNASVEAMLSSHRKVVQQLIENYRESRATWYQSLYRLRIRTGIWTATLMTSLVMAASSLHIWQEVLVPAANKLSWESSSCNGDYAFFGCLSIVCQTLAVQLNDVLPPELCDRTLISLFSGTVAALLCLLAIGLHLLTRSGAAQVVENSHHEDHQQTHRIAAVAAAAAAAASCHNGPITYFMAADNHIVMKNNVHRPSSEAVAAAAALVAASSHSFDQGGGSFTVTHTSLRSEFILAIILAILLGLNAVFATSVQGPAASVGNLYYASWISFLLCLRIGLGCLEELFNIDVEEHQEDDQSNDYSAPPPPTDVSSEAGQDNKSSSTRSNKSFTFSQKEEKTDLMENLRAQRTRKHLVIGISCTVCSASAMDAAYNQSDPLDLAQQYVILAPSIVAVLSACQFLLCLWSSAYRRAISRMWLGGTLSIVTFGVCLGELVITMHSESSWAVNSIGDIKIANLYYFSWASILTAGVQMMSYVNHYLGVLKKQDDYVTAVWIVVCKVCFVILGAGYHIWHTVSDTCSLQDLHEVSGGATFCSRTVFALAVSCTGMFVSGLVAFCRVVVVRSSTHVEAVVSCFLMLLFGAAVAIITGIGGPGQSVGDMFYATWLTFLVTIGLVTVCVDEILQQDHQSNNNNDAYIQQQP